MSSIDLSAIARQAMIDEGFVVEVDDAVISEVQSLQEKESHGVEEPHGVEESHGGEGGLAPAIVDDAATSELQPLQQKEPHGLEESHGREGRLAPAPALDPSVQDLRELLWSSIDDVKTRDLDQVEYAELLSNGDTRVLIGIADVDAFVPKGSATDQRAGLNATSVYTGVKTFPMLPEELSTGLTSLLPDQDRFVVVTEMTIAPDGALRESNVYRAIARNHAKLSYTAVGDWLDGRSEVPKAVKTKPGLEEQIRLQHETASRLGELRKQHGAIELGTIQTTPRVDERGKVVELVVIEPNAARDLISNFMIAANVAMAQYLEIQGGPSLRRVVRTPEHWDRIVEIAAELREELPAKPDARALALFLERRRKADPDRFPDLSLAVVKSLGPGEYAVQLPGEEGEGHFGLAVTDYTHSTAPNRRYADLVTQRLVKAALKDESPPFRAEKSVPYTAETWRSAPEESKSTPSAAEKLKWVPYTAETLKSVPYTVEELKRIAEHCTQREDAARKVERKIRKVAAALLLRDQIGSEFEAIVTGVSPKGVFARTCKPPVDGRIVRGERGLGIGDKVRVRLKDVNPKRGFIDFVRFARGW